ncbi:MAG: universal stress protein [Desulfovibrionales bacterium]
METREFRKILVAVDASENAMRAISYAGDIVGSTSGFHIKLLYVERLPERDLFPDENTWKDACKKQENQVREFLENGRKTLLDKGVAQSSISDEYVVHCRSPFYDPPPDCSLGHSIAQNILKAAERGGFGTVVVGRRGVSKAEEFLFGSVSTKIIHSARNCTVWVVE